MLLAGVCQAVGAALLMPTFLGVPLAIRIPVQGVAVAFIVGGLVAIPVMITEVVSADIRGIAFSVTGFLSAIAGAARGGGGAGAPAAAPAAAPAPAVPAPGCG